jgi:hypothetical protein
MLNPIQLKEYFRRIRTLPWARLPGAPHRPVPLAPNRRRIVLLIASIPVTLQAAGRKCDHLADGK